MRRRKPPKDFYDSLRGQGDAPDTALALPVRPLWPPSPKVWGPVILGLVWVAINWWATGTFDLGEIKAVILTFIFGGGGYLIPDNKPLVRHFADTQPHDREEFEEPDKRRERTHPPARD